MNNNIDIFLINKGSDETELMDISKTCALIHSSVISEGFLPKLGVQFLTTLYISFARSEYSFLVVAKENDIIVGFIAISLHTKKFYKWFVRNNMVLISFQIIPKIVNFTFFIKIFESLMYPFKGSPKLPKISNSEIFNFCVVDSCQGKGVGRLLFQQAINELKLQDISTLKIVTGKKQISAQKFYNSCGATVVYETNIHKGDTSLIYQYDIT